MTKVLNQIERLCIEIVNSDSFDNQTKLRVQVLAMQARYRELPEEKVLEEITAIYRSAKTE